MDFQFAPWERLTRDVADGDADARVEVERQIWLVRICGELLWARRESDVGSEHNILLWEDLEDNQLANGRAERLKPEHLNRYLREAKPEQYVCRVWRFDNSVFAACHQSDGGWRLYKNIYSLLLFNWKSVPFKFPAANLAPASAVFAALQKDWNNAESDLNYSARFLELDELNRALLGMQTQIGTPHEWAALITATARACVSRWPAEIGKIQLNFCANGSQRRFTCEDDSILGVRERAILGHIMRVCQPQQLPDDPAFPSALRTLTEGGWSCSFSMEIARPSMHEQLESALMLRPWLQENWPDGVKHLGKIV